MIKVLVIGNSAREHALVSKLAQSNKVNEIYAIPGNPGIAYLAKTVAMDYTDIDAIVKFAVKHQFNLVVVGLTLSLSIGLVDALEAVGIRCFGPKQHSMQLGTSKLFAKQLMQTYHIPTTEYQYFTDALAAKKYLEGMPDQQPIIIKYDDLGKNKGRRVTNDVLEAHHIIDEIFNKPNTMPRVPGVIIEDFIDVEELSILAFVDSDGIQPMLPVQDYQYIHPMNHGSRFKTSGLGTYAPAKTYTADISEAIQTQILTPLEKALKNEQLAYSGFLHLRLILTDTGPKVTEIYVNLGDPEAEVLLPLLRSDLYEIMMACVHNELADYPVIWRSDYAVCLVMASGGYPDKFEINLPITDYCIYQEGMEQNSWVYHACTKLNPRGKLVTAGGKVVVVTAIGKTFEEAQRAAYKRVHQISFKNCYFSPHIYHQDETKLLVC